MVIQTLESLERADEALDFKILEQSKSNVRDLSELREDFTNTQRLNEKNHS